MFLVIGLWYLYFKSISLLRSTLNDLSKGNYFSGLVITNFRRFGQLCIACGIGHLIIPIILGFFVTGTTTLTINSTLWLFLVIGLFFMFLSEAFTKAKQIENENNLTI